MNASSSSACNGSSSAAVSPVNSSPPAGSHSAIDPAVWPGTCRTSKARLPEVHDIALSEETRWLRGGRPPAGDIEVSPRDRGDHTLGRFVAVPTDLVLETGPEVRPQQREPVGFADPVGIVRVAPTLVERVQSSDVVEMVVRGDGNHRSIATSGASSPRRSPIPLPVSTTRSRSVPRTCHTFDSKNGSR